MSAEINIQYVLEGTCVYISIEGEIDIYTSEKLKKEVYKIIEENNFDVVFNFEKLKYIDSIGLGILVGALKKIKTNDKEVKIINLNQRIKKLFSITGLENLFKIEG